MNLDDYREEIDRINQDIVDAISRRMEIVQEIGEYKEKHDMEIQDEEREEVVKQQFEELFKEENLPPEKGREMANLLIDIALQEEMS